MAETRIADDSKYGPIRAEICDRYIAAGKPQPERNWLYSRLVETTFNYKQFVFDVSQVIGEIDALGEEMTGDVRAGILQAMEELRERLGIGKEVEEVSRG